MKCGVLQGLPGPLLLLIYINDLHVAIKYSEVHHIADDTNLLNFNSCVTSINKQANYDLKRLNKLVKGKTNPLNVGKTVNLGFLLHLRKKLTVI